MLLTRRHLLTVAALVGFGLFARAADPPQGQRVFSAGHSFHMFMPALLKDMAKAANISGHEQVGEQMLGGSRTIQHWDLPDEKNKAKTAIKTGKVDVLTLSPHLKLPDEGIDHFVKLALENNPKAQIMVQASWMAFDDPKNFGKKFANDDRNNAKIEDLRKAYEPFGPALRDQLSGINKQYEEKFKRQVVFLVPAGHAVLNLREQVVAGKVPGIEKQADLFNDPIGHGKPPVQVLTAYCNFAVIYKQSPVGLPAPPRLGQSEHAEKLNKLLQEIAWDAVTREPLSGVKRPD
jgi:hypothetical protein